MGVFKFGVIAVVVGLSGCSEKVSQCTTNADCTNVAYPFCDVNGMYAPSDGDKNVCTIIPPDCPIDVCGCSPGATTCAAGELTTCNTDGKSTTSDACALGCASTNDRCLTFTPLNGLGPAMTAAATEPAITIPAGSTINTDTGIVRNSANATIAVTTLVVTGPTDIRVFLGGSFDIDDVVISGAKAAAFVSPGAVTINGMIDASANKNVSGPGAASTGCVGQTAIDSGSSQSVAGGGGHATAGGDGIFRQTFQQGNALLADGAGGITFTGSTLVGGCIGGGGSVAGGGGGAVQIDSLTKIEFSSAPKLGFIDVGGGGAQHASQLAAGGGAGGTVILEAPEVDVGGVTANGGSGTTCGVDGNDATPDKTPAPAIFSSCTMLAGRPNGGAGATFDQAPNLGGGAFGGGGGGGAAGTLFINTSSGAYTSVTGSVVSAFVSGGSISPM